MDKFVITGGTPLKGEIRIGGAKNAAVAIIPAALLVDGVCRIENIPCISDVNLIINILKSIGSSIKVINKNTLEINCKNVGSYTLSSAQTSGMRASSYFIGALLGRFNRARVAPPGGCDFGVRPIDQHIKGFEALGARVIYDNAMVDAKATELVGSSIYLDANGYIPIGEYIAEFAAHGKSVKIPFSVVSEEQKNAVKITGQPGDVIAADGATASVKVEATGVGLKYQWYYTSNGSSSYFNKSGSTTATYSTTMDASKDGRKVYCVITDKYGNKVTSNTVTLKLKTAESVKITKQPVNVTVNKGGTASVSVTATGEGLKYQWYYTSSGAGSYFNKSSNTTSTYSTTMDESRDGRKVYCVVTDKNGNKVTSNTVTLKMSK